jgi:hypothetical protein
VEADSLEILLVILVAKVLIKLVNLNVVKIKDVELKDLVKPMETDNVNYHILMNLVIPVANV